MRKLMYRIALLLSLSLNAPLAMAGEPVAHVMICCRAGNEGAAFLVNGVWNPDHDYTDINVTRGILQNIKNAGINTIAVDWTNPSQWTILWNQFKPMMDNIRQVCSEKNMNYIAHIGIQLPPDIRAQCNIPDSISGVDFWNNVTKYIDENWAKDAAYKHYGYGDDRPILIVFDRAIAVNPLINSIPANKTNYFMKFHIATEMVNISTTPGETDGWGYRNYMQNASGSVRFASPESGLAPTDPWIRISKEEWKTRVDWCKASSEYSIFGSYDDTNDCIHWGILDTKNLPSSNTTKKYPGDDPWLYYNIVRSALKPRAAGNMLPVTNLIATVKKDTVELSWDKNQEADFGAYRIYQSTDNNHSFKLFAYGIKPNNFTNTGFEPGKTYYYMVTTVDTLMGFESGYSDTVRVTPNARVLNQYKFDFNKTDNTEGWTGNSDIGSLTEAISQNGSDGILKSASGILGNNPKLSFQGNLTLNHADSWAQIEVRIRQMGLDGKTPQTWDPQGTASLIQSLNALNLGELIFPKWSIKTEASGNWIVATADISGIAANIISGLSISPIGNSAGIGKNFELDYVYLKKYSPMPVPGNLSAVAVNNNIKLTWNKIPDKDIKMYRIYRNPLTGNSNQSLAYVSDTTFFDFNPNDGLTYGYSVSAIDSLGNESDKSAEVKFQSKNGKQMACYQFELNTSGSTDNWTANGDVNQLTQAISINGVDGVVKSINGISGIDPMLFYNTSLKLPTPASKWISLELRVRQLNALQTGSQPWNPQGTIGYFVAPDAWNAGEIKSPAFEVSSEPIGDWVVAKLDISRIGSNPITNFRIDLIGDSPGIGKNFELDYVRLFCTPYDLIPPATPSGFKAIAGNSQIKLSWDANNEPDLLGYNLYRSSQTGRPVSKYKIGIKYNEFTDSLLINGQNYIYQLAAIDSSGNESTRTSLISATPGVMALTNPYSNSMISRAYPNPFSGETTIEFSLNQAGNVVFEIFNINGQKLVEIVRPNQSCGANSLIWNGKSDSGKSVSAGIYFCRISCNQLNEYIKLIKN